ncbi:MAG: indole-3-glycerol phosphate synthase TrpC [Paracoccaceae bacterium]|nr:indole-3-glycerol phosphate synthase TrpC [Paracoccaceae bacterium]
MNSILEKIRSYKIEEIKNLKSKYSLRALEDIIREQPLPKGFQNSLKAASSQGYGLIAEVKKASPSKGIIREDFTPLELAKAYESGGATCISVLTDFPSFQGKGKYLSEISKTVNLPTLRKDFMLDPHQIYESRSLGADCILLILAMIDDYQARELEEIALKLGMDILMEVHDEDELERALELKSNLIGINNRNLNTFHVTLDTSLELIKEIPEGIHVVSESGLFTKEDLDLLAERGIRSFLIGESLMRKQDIVSATRSLLMNPLPRN